MLAALRALPDDAAQQAIDQALARWQGPGDRCLTIAEADKTSLLMLATLATMMQSLQLSSSVMPHLYSNEGDVASMLRTAMRSLRNWMWIGIGVGALLTVSIALATDRAHSSYKRALAPFGVRPATYAEDMAAVTQSILSHTPVGSPRIRVIALLDTLGFTPSTDPFDQRPAFHIDSMRGNRAIYAHWPFQDPPLSLDQFVCDRPALRLAFQFDEQWKLAVVEVNDARGCI